MQNGFNFAKPIFMTAHAMHMLKNHKLWLGTKKIALQMQPKTSGAFNIKTKLLENNLVPGTSMHFCKNMQPVRLLKSTNMQPTGFLQKKGKQAIMASQPTCSLKGFFLQHQHMQPDWLLNPCRNFFAPTSSCSLELHVLMQG